MSTVDYDPYAPEIQHNPYPTYKRLRDEAPVYYSEKYNFYMLTRYDDCMAAFLDPATFISGRGVTIEPMDNGGGRLNSMDPPDHTRLRKLLSRIFTPKRMVELEPFIRGVACGYLDKVAGQDRFDLVQDFSLRLPLDVISELLGIPEELRKPIHDLTNATVIRDASDPAQAVVKARAAMGEILGVYTSLVEDRRKNPKDDIISMLIQAEVAGEDGKTYKFSDQEIAAQFLLLGGAGHETVMKTVSNGAVALWWYKDQRRELVEDPRLIPTAIEEMLRWDNPAPLEGRQTTREVTLHGVTIPEDSRVMINMGAANHDERQYELPELFNIHRKMERSLIFGFGVHLCLGAHLARMESKIAFEELLKRYPEYEIDEAHVDRGPVTFFRGLHHLPLVV
jgi:cytochrome P450